jgi:cobyric acid synthase
LFIGYILSNGGVKMDRAKVLIKIVNEHEEKYAEIKINSERFLYSEISHFTVNDIVKILEKTGISVEYKDIYLPDSEYRIFPEYKAFIEDLAETNKQTVRQYLESHTKLYEMLTELIKTEATEAYAAERGIETVPVQTVYEPEWYYTTMGIGEIDQERWEQIHNSLELKIKAELGLA